MNKYGRLLSCLITGKHLISSRPPDFLYSPYNNYIFYTWAACLWSYQGIILPQNDQSDKTGLTVMNYMNGSPDAYTAKMILM